MGGLDTKRVIQKGMTFLDKKSILMNYKKKEKK